MDLIYLLGKREAEVLSLGLEWSLSFRGKQTNSTELERRADINH